MTRTLPKTLRIYQYATSIALVSSILICTALVWFHLNQRHSFARSVSLVDHFRQARIDLNAGFTQVALGDAEDAPFDRARGRALLTQAIDDMKSMAESGTYPLAPLDGDASLADLEQAAAAVIGEVDRLDAAGANRHEVETALRIAFAALDRRAHQLDLDLQQALREHQAALNRTFLWGISVAGVLLLGVTLTAHGMSRLFGRAVRELHASEDRLEALVENLAEGVVLADPTGRFVHWNRSALQLHGFTHLSEVNSRVADLRELFQLNTPEGESIPFERWPFNRLFRGETVHDLEVRLRRLDVGLDRVLIYNGGTVEISGGLRFTFLSFVDVTQRRQTEDAQRLFRRLVDASTDAFEVLDPVSGRLIDINEALCRQLGYTRDEMLRMTVFDIAPLRTPETWPQDVGAVREAGSLRNESILRRKDGSTFPTELTVTWVELDKPYVLVVARDITERRLAEQALREQQEKLIKLTDTAPGVICSFRLGPDGRVSFPYASPRIRDIYDVEPAELAVDASAAAERWHPEDVARMRASIEQSREQLTPWHEEFRVLHPQRGELWIEGHSIPAREADGATVWYGIIIDITDRKRIDREFQHQSRLLRETGSLARVGGWELDVPTGKGRWTPEVACIHDLDPAVPPNAELSLKCYPGEARTRLEAALQAAVTRGEPYDLELPFVSATGRHKWVRTISRPDMADGRVVRISGAMQDITDRKLAELRAEVMHETIQALAEAPDLPVASTRILQILCERFEWDLGELWVLDRSSRTLRHLALWAAPGIDAGEFAARTRPMEFAAGVGLPGRVLQSGTLIWVPDVVYDPTFLRPDEARRIGMHGALGVPIKSRGETAAVVLLFRRDIREPDGAAQSTLVAVGAQLGQSIERRSLEAKILQTQKLEAIGTLAGGIAHDFNNILSAIVGFAGLAKLGVADRPEVAENLDDLLTAARRATDLVRQILSFSRVQSGTRQVIQLRHVLDEARKLLRASIPTSIEFAGSIDPKAPSVLADPTQVHQVIMNLGTNAAHAMRGAPGRLTFSLSGVQLDSVEASRLPGLKPGRYALLSVSDTGHGIDPATLARIFDPFFTTKAPGEGSGMGLSVVHGIIQRHEGAIGVQSRPGEGTRFDVYFPACDAAPVEDGTAEPEVVRGQGQHILCIDDEDLLVRAMERALTLWGYTVTTATDPQTALDLFRSAPDHFAVVLVDLTMPHMLGTEVGRRVREIRADIPIILMTGYSGTLTEDQARALDFAALLHKPISPNQLSARLAAVLGRG